MQISGWKYYNHAAIPTTAPHEPINTKPIEDGSIWKIDGKPLLIRWHTDWDCGYETEWWYCIKDTPFDINQLKAKRRYEINKGRKNFEVRIINPSEYTEQLFKVQEKAFFGWPKKYRPVADKEVFIKSAMQCEGTVFGGFDMVTSELCAYALLSDFGSYVDFTVLRAIPDCEKLGINAAMVSAIVDNYKDRFDGRFYINDGSRVIRHETNFQDYLEKYFGFRKAYCRIHIKYRFPISFVVALLFPHRDRIRPNSKIGSQISAILRMEEIARNQI